MRNKPPWEHELSEFNSPKVSYWIPGEVRDVEGELRAVSVGLRSQEVHWLHQFSILSQVDLCREQTSFHDLSVYTKPLGGQN